MKKRFAIAIAVLSCCYAFPGHDLPLRRPIPIPKPILCPEKVDVKVLGVNRHSVFLFKTVFRLLTQQELHVGKKNEIKECGALFLGRVDGKLSSLYYSDRGKTLYLLADPRDLIVHQRDSILCGISSNRKGFSKRELEKFINLNPDQQISYLIQHGSIKKNLEKVCSSEELVVVRVEDLICEDANKQNAAISKIASFFE
ncbi:MAG: hypothetical protein FJZ57_06935, partial [Chlamydiae bacterium]|nr:hypothetical protein [Chlamydiota bacterium]